MHKSSNPPVSSSLSIAGQEGLYRLAADIHYIVKDVSGVINEEDAMYTELLQDLWSHMVSLLYIRRGYMST